MGVWEGGPQGSSKGVGLLWRREGCVVGAPTVLVTGQVQAFSLIERSNPMLLNAPLGHENDYSSTPN